MPFLILGRENGQENRAEEHTFGGSLASVTFGDDIVARRRERPALQTRVVRRLRSTANVPGCPRSVGFVSLADRCPAEVSRAMPGDPRFPGTPQPRLSGDPPLETRE